MESKRVEKGDRVVWFNEKGEYHRLDGPAVEFYIGTKQWWFNGKLHRECGPAAEWHDGSKFWYLNGKMYSEEQWEEEVIKLKLNRIKGL